MRSGTRSGWIAFAAMLAALPATAQAAFPQAGWQTELSRIAHDVSGRVTVIDENTIQIDDFTFDGGGLSVYFYLGAEDTRAAFLTGLEIGPQLLGTVFDGTQPPLVIDLPAGTTLEGYGAISVWCVTVGSSFGSGTFAPPAVTGDYNGNGIVDAADYTVWRDLLGTSGPGLAADATGPGGEPDGIVGPHDYDLWKSRFGESAGSAAAATAVPEPGGWPALMAVGLGIAWARRPWGRLCRAR